MRNVAIQQIAKIVQVMEVFICMVETVLLKACVPMVHTQIHQHTSAKIVIQVVLFAKQMKITAFNVVEYFLYWEMCAIQTVQTDIFKMQETVTHVILSVANAKRPLPTVVPVLPMGLISHFWMEVLVLMSYYVQQERMLKVQPMFVKFVTQAVHHAKAVKITVQVVRGIYLFYQIFVT